MTRPEDPAATYRPDEHTPAALMAAARFNTGNDSFPCNIGIDCDWCGTAVERDYVVNERMTRPQRHELARSYLRALGWTCTPGSDLCPACAPIKEITVSDPNSPARLAQKAADALREVNHATIVTGDQWRYPSHAYDTTLALADTARRLPQAVEQVVALIDLVDRAGFLGVTPGKDRSAAYGQLVGSSTVARSAAEKLTEALDQMAVALSPMTYTGTDDDGDEG